MAASVVLPLPRPMLSTAVRTSRLPVLSVAYTALMNFFCHGLSLNGLPAIGPAEHGRDSMNRITFAARERPGDVHGCETKVLLGPSFLALIGFARAPRWPNSFHSHSISNYIFDFGCAP